MKLRARYPAMVAGLAVFALAVTVLLGSEFGSDLAAAAVEAAGNDYVVVAVFGAVALLLVFVVAASRALFGQDQAVPPDPESVRTAPHPGAEFDRVVDDGPGLRSRLFGDGGEAVRERLRGHAVEAVLRGESGVTSREAARERVLAGSWTDDDAAAAFLAGPEGPSPSLESRVAGAVRGETWFQYGARRAADEVCRLLGVDTPAGDGSGGRDADDTPGGTEFPGHGRAGTGPDSGPGSNSGSGAGDDRSESTRRARAAADGGRESADRGESGGDDEPGGRDGSDGRGGSDGRASSGRNGGRTADTVVSDAGGDRP